MECANLEQEVIALSKEKWRWMSERDVGALDALFHEKSVFIHMGGAWGKEREIEIIKSGGIHYKQADIHEVSVKIHRRNRHPFKQNYAASRGWRQRGHQSIYGDRSVCAATG